jgi:hypothetical protein
MRRRDKQPVRCLDRCPGGTVEHAYLQMSVMLIHSLTKEIELGIMYTIYETQAVLASCHRLGHAKSAPYGLSAVQT